MTDIVVVIILFLYVLVLIQVGSVVTQFSRYNRCVRQFINIFDIFQALLFLITSEVFNKLYHRGNFFDRFGHSFLGIVNGEQDEVLIIRMYVIVLSFSNTGQARKLSLDEM